ncbi:MAG TPA: hypothetical protein VKZ54_00770 [Membranihabitans sp.]|nr:hypothetical protein [Membranihabitans sp.]
MRTLFLLLSLMVSLVIDVTSQGLSMSPTRLFFSGNPGETITQTVRLGNSSDKEYNLSVSYKDWERDHNGNKIYTEPGTREKSNASWVSTDQNTIRVPANGQKEVQVTMQIPEYASVSTETNSMMFFTQLPQQSDRTSTSTGIGIVTLFEFGLHVYYTPPANTLKSLEITNIEEVQGEDQNRKVAITIFNDGNTFADATVEFELTNTDSGEEIKLKPQTISMFPEAEQVVQFSIPQNISGDFLGVTIIKMSGTNDLRVGEKNFKF